MLDESIVCLKGIGKARAAMFEKAGIRTVRDLLYCFPRGYEDRSKIKYISDCVDEETVCIRAAVFSSVKEVRVRRGLDIYTLRVCDDSGGAELVWYNNRYVKNAFKIGQTYSFFGSITKKGNGTRMMNPVYEHEDRYTGKIVPIYPLSGELTQNMMRSAAAAAVEYSHELEEYLPHFVREENSLAQIEYAVRNIHFPENEGALSTARRRLVFEELLMYSLAVGARKQRRFEGPPMKDISYAAEFEKMLPFEPTGAQKRVIDDICVDMQSGTSMNRLVQGDVGSGKTAVAAAAVYTAVKNGYQACMMAPTEILARQHYETLTQMFGGTGIRTVLLTGSMKEKEKREVYEQLSEGEADFAVGTHAVIQKNVEFKKLGLVIADEQHRFGVGQRSSLMAKGENPHMLVMSATPIPRTLALIIYGDLDVSVIDEMPPGRKTVKTYAVGEKLRGRAYNFLKKQLDEGMQGYIVCPLVEETENSDLQNAVDLRDRVQELLRDYKVGLVHGRMKPSEKESVMNSFSSGELHVLVSTTVIEVGVNVPRSNIMIIENAERFGLSQLHQLRGRVGRGGDQAYCVLIAHGSGELTKKRMDAICGSNDGFYIAEQDLKLRGPGDFFGTRQHGLPDMRIANLFEDVQLLSEAQKAAEKILENGMDSTLETKVRRVFSDGIIMN